MNRGLPEAVESGIAGAPDVVPATAAQSLDALDHLLETLQPLRKLQAAYEAWFADAEDPGKYDIGPRAAEVMVTFFDVDEAGKTVKARASLQSLLDRVEGRFQVERAVIRQAADPRTEIRGVLSDVRKTVTQAVALARTIVDARTLQTFVDALLAEIAQQDEQTARRIAHAVRHRIVLYRAGRENGAPLGADRTGGKPF